MQIRKYVARADGLRECDGGSAYIRIHQVIDGKSLNIDAANLEEVLFRSDADGQDFIQVNFRSGAKILITDTLIGFKPTVLNGLDMAKLPRVVTTPDILSVFEAIQEALHSSDPQGTELALLRRVFEAVISGGEFVGFDLNRERAWLRRIPASVVKVTA